MIERIATGCGGSWNETLRLLREAEKRGHAVAGDILGVIVVATPGDCADCLYDAHKFYSAPLRKCGSCMKVAVKP